MGRIDVQDIDRGATARRQADKTSPVPFEMAAPALPAGIEQDCDAAGDGVMATQIARLSQVTFEARPSQVIRIVGTMVLLGDNVFDVKIE